MFPNSTAGQRLALIPEILSKILQGSGRGDQARSARVCKFWCDIASGLFWETVEDLRVLFQLLAPLTAKNGSILFTRALARKDWVRFDYYACKVRQVLQKKWHSQCLHYSLINEILSTRSPLDLLPNLRCVQSILSNSLNCLHVFLHSSVIELTIHYEDGFSLLGANLSSLPAKTPAITDLFISGNVAIAGDNTSSAIAMLAEALSGLSLLRSLTLPIPWFTPAMVDAVASCSSLHKLSTSTLDDEGDHIEDFDYNQLYSLSLPTGRFSAISFLSVVLPFPLAAKFFSQGSHFDALTRFEAQSPDSIVEPHEYAIILSALPKYCPNLEGVTLFATSPRGDATEHDAITYRELSSITHFAALQSVSFLHTMPFQLVTKDLVAIVRALPNLTTLVLNPTPHFATASPLAISVLSMLRDLCPNLVSLGLYLNAVDEHIPLPPANDDEDRRGVPAMAEFTNLKSFTIGWTSLSSPLSLAVYLSSVLPDDCVLDTSHDAMHRKEVRRLIPVFKQVRAQGIRTGRITCGHSS